MFASLCVGVVSSLHGTYTRPRATVIYKQHRTLITVTLDCSLFEHRCGQGSPVERRALDAAIEAVTRWYTTQLSGWVAGIGIGSTDKGKRQAREETQKGVPASEARPFVVSM